MNRDHARKAAAFIALVAVLVLSGFADAFKTVAQENAPKFMVSPDGKMTGICVDIMRALERVDPSLRFTGESVFAPLKRIEAGLISGEYDVFLGFARTKDKEALYRYVEIPLYPVKKVLAVRSDDTIAISSFSDIAKLGAQGIVLAIAASASAEQARAAGAQVEDGATTPEQCLQKLMAGRGRFYFHTDIAIVQAARNLGLEKKIRILPFVYSQESQYMVFSKNVPEDRVRRVEAALRGLGESGELMRIFQKYLE